MKTKTEKEEIIKELKENFKKAIGFVIVNLQKLKGEEEFRLKEILKENNSDFKIYKKTLIYKANPNFAFKDEELKFPFGIIWEFNENLPAFKAIRDLEKEGIFLEILKGYLEGRVLSKEEVITLSKLPSKEELIAKVVFTMKNVFQRLAFTLNFPKQKLVLTLSAIKEKNK